MSTTNSKASDQIVEKLISISQNILVVIFGLLPLFFIPSVSAPFEYTKILVVIIGIAAALILFSLSLLRSGKLVFSYSYTLLALWGVVLIVLLAALFSGDFRDAFVGDQFSVHSAAFVALLALAASIWSLIRVERIVIMRLYILLSVSTIVLVLFHLLRLFFGADLLALNIFQSSVSSPIGAWNDLALFLGLAILLSLVALEQLQLNREGKILFAVVTVLSLGMLSVINFFAVWLVLGLVSLVMLVYILSKGRMTQANSKKALVNTTNVYSFALSLAVAVVALIFIIGGSAVSGFINKHTDISFVEVRPSLEATTGIARSVYAENAFLGIGPNKFVDAWRLYKDPAINATVFWNTDFRAGSGYIPSFFVTSGVLGGMVWLVFLGTFLYFGIRNLLRTPETDRVWYFIGVSSFVSAAYIWTMSVIYVPGPVLLLLGAVCTGLAVVATQTLSAVEPKTFSIGANRRTGFIFTLIILAVIIGSVQALYSVGQHYRAAYTFNSAKNLVRPGVNIAELEAKLDVAFALSPDDVFARSAAEYQLAKMNTLLALESPTDTEQQQFQEALVNGVNSGRLATQYDSTEPANWAVLGNIYSLLVSANIEGSYDRAFEALTKARDLDPVNPSRHLALAQLEVRANNLDPARESAERAISLKANYSDGLFFLTQLEILTGNVEGAIRSARAIISLEPQNPARYYQLGVLESARGDTEAAVSAFERAVALDPNYANALYFLALGYDKLGRTNEARRLLERVLQLNPGNQDVASLIASIDEFGSIGESLRTSAQPALVETAVGETGETVFTTGEPDSALIKPVNIAPSEEVLDQFDLEETIEEDGIIPTVEETEVTP